MFSLYQKVLSLSTEYTPSGPTIVAFHNDPSFVRIIMGPLGCLSADTEFLTEGGWKRMDAWQPGDAVAEWNQSDGRIEMAQPLDYVKLPCTEFWHFHNRYGLSMVLSDEHRMPLYDYRGAFAVKTAGEVARTPSRYQVPVSFAPPAGAGLGWPEPHIRLSVAINADGHFPKAGKMVTICVRKERKKRRLRRLLSACGLDWRERNYPARPTETSFDFLADGFTKGFGPEWWQADADELSWVLDECTHWDGLADHIECRFFSSSKSDADFIQYAAHALGRRASVTPVKDKRNSGWKPCYTVQITNPGSFKAKVGLRGDHTAIERVVSADGFKYCFRTSSGFFVARHNGRIFITGNSGKTTACCFEILGRALAQTPDEKGVRKSRWLVCRNTVPELETTTLPSWRQHFGTELGSWKMTAPITHSWRFPCADGTRVEADIFFLGLDGQDAANKIRGMELTGAWLNEAKDIPRSVIDMVTGRVDRYPAKKLRNWVGVIADTNMPDDDHWLYDLAEKQRPDNWAFFRQPGAVTKVGEKWVLSELRENQEHLGERYYSNQLSGKSDEWIRVFLAAEYGYVAEGRPVYPEYSDTHHVDDLEPIPEAPLYIGGDFGLTPAVVFLQRDVWGRYLVIDEMVTSDVGAKPFAQAIKKFAAQRFPGYAISGAWGDPIGNKRQAAHDDALSTFQIMKANGVPFHPAPGNNELVIRREAVANCLTRLVDGKPGLIINRRCTKLRAGMAGKYFFKRVAMYGEIFADRPDKGEHSHVCEALQYALLGLGEGREITQNKAERQRRPNVVSGTKHSHRNIRKNAGPGRGRRSGAWQ